VAEPFPGCGPDGEEPDGSGPLPAEGDGWPEQGLYVCLPAEQLRLPGFAQGGAADTMAPGALATRLNIVIRGPCDHAQAEHRYRPGRKLQHLIRIRSTRCTAPGCACPAARCDLDHTRPWHHGGPTCPCNLAPLCRHHHRCKQAQGWQLEQPEPGILRWRTPSGRTYTTTPTQYPA